MGEDGADRGNLLVGAEPLANSDGAGLGIVLELKVEGIKVARKGAAGTLKSDRAALHLRGD